MTCRFVYGHAPQGTRLRGLNMGGNIVTVGQTVTVAVKDDQFAGVAGSQVNPVGRNAGINAVGRLLPFLNDPSYMAF